MSSWVCSIHGATRINEFPDGGVKCGVKLQDGTWCKERMPKPQPQPRRQPSAEPVPVSALLPSNDDTLKAAALNFAGLVFQGQGVDPEHAVKLAVQAFQVMKAAK